MPHAESKEDVLAKNYGQLVSFSDDNMDALLRSRAAAVKGFEDIAKLYGALANQPARQPSAALNAKSDAEIPADAQNHYGALAKKCFDAAIALLTTEFHRL